MYDTTKNEKGYFMKLTRVAMTITFTPVIGDGFEINKDTHLKQFKEMLWRSAQNKTADEFREDLTIWQTMHGFVEEEDVTAKSVEQVDRALVHHMQVDCAREVLTSAATVKAMLNTFAQLSADASEDPNQIN